VAGAAVMMGWPASAMAGEVEVRVTRPAPGRVILEVADATVAVRKEVTLGQSTVTITTPTERVVLTVRRGVLSFSGTHGRRPIDWQAGRQNQDLLEELGRSTAVALARDLLAQVPDGPGSFVGQSLLLTRAILEAGTGGVEALRTYYGWVSDRAASSAAGSTDRASGRPRVILAGLEGMQLHGPDECWDLYSKEAIRIAEDFSDCTKDLEWYQVAQWTGCTLIYTVRAEGAMAWFIACNGGMPFRG